MKESDFIRQNKKKWLDFENNLLQKDTDPSKTSRLFVQITDDLSYARTFYKNRSVRVYLNSIARLLFNDLNKSRDKRFGGFTKFWKTDLPLAMHRSRRAMLISFLVFAACFILGIVTSIQDKSFAEAILSRDYVNMTNENISKGDAMGVYKKGGEFESFLYILLNNLRVDFLTFFSGIFMAVGSIVVMITNGVMVGVFQYFFIKRGLFWTSFLSIWTHGSLEIPAIILCGGAGLVLGKGLLFPGTHSRFQALRLYARDGLKIIIGVIPVTVIAAFIEGFLTRHTEIPDLLRLLFILCAFSFVIFYFIFYPRRVASRHSSDPQEMHQALVYKQEAGFNPTEIFSNFKIITETFRLLFTHFAVFGRWLLFISLGCSLLVVFNPLGLFRAPDSFNFSAALFFNYSEYPVLGILTIACMCALLLRFMNYLRGVLLPGAAGAGRALPLKVFFSVLLSATLFEFIIFTGFSLTMVVAQIFFPFLIFIASISEQEGLNFYDSTSYAARLFAQSPMKFIMAMVSFFLLSLLVYSTSTYGLKALLLNDALIWALTSDQSTATNISLGIVAFQTFFSFFLYLTLSIISNSLLFFTLKEIFSAEHLIAKIRNIHVSK